MNSMSPLLTVHQYVLPTVGDRARFTTQTPVTYDTSNWASKDRIRISGEVNVDSYNLVCLLHFFDAETSSTEILCRTSV